MSPWRSASMRLAAEGLVLFLLIGASIAGSYALSLHVQHQGQQRLCTTFAYFIRKPAPPLNTVLKQQQEAQYLRLLEFERRLGCREGWRQ